MTNRCGRLGYALVGALLAFGCSDDGNLSPVALSGGTGDSGISPTGGASDSRGTTGSGSAGSISASGGGSGSTGAVDPTISSGTTEDPTLGGSDSSGGSSDSSGGGGSTSTGPGPECTIDTDCDPGNVCEGEMCVPGCTGRQPCADGLECCSGECIDTTNSLLHCGVCDNACDIPENQDVACDGVSCQLGECDDDTYDCDGLPGCESDIECACVPMESQPCYPGPAGTEDVGICTGGTQQCNMFGTGWGACVGFQLPQASEVCANNLDDDCNGFIDDVLDIDGDGWTFCDNDCCETEFECGDPTLVNPGAFEFVGNDVDDDCDPATSDAVEAPACSNAANFGAVDPEDIAEAMDLCQTTTENPPLEDRRWGVISAEFLTANGLIPVANHLSTMRESSTAIMTDYGTGGVGPLLNATMGGMSSGMMRDANDPGYVQPNSGSNFGFVHNPPASYLAANAGVLPTSIDCNGTACAAGSGANDSVMLRLRIRVPTNAQSFSYSFRFFSSEYWTYACTQWNDFFLAILDSDAAGLPADGNISFDSLGNPVSVNNGFFEHCVPNGCYTCPNGSGAMAGTGMEIGSTGGGTQWLVTTAPVVPGEIITLDLSIFDVSDNILDSLVLLDAFEWDIDPSDVGTNPQG